MPDVSQILAKHVRLEVSCVDRIYLGGFMPILQTPGQLVYFLTKHLGKPIPSPALLGQLTEDFRLSPLRGPVRPAARCPGAQIREGRAQGRHRRRVPQAVYQVRGRLPDRDRPGEGFRLLRPTGRPWRTSLLAVFPPTGLRHTLLLGVSQGFYAS